MQAGGAHPGSPDAEQRNPAVGVVLEGVHSLSARMRDAAAIDAHVAHLPHPTR